MYTSAHCSYTQTHTPCFHFCKEESNTAMPSLWLWAVKATSRPRCAQRHRGEPQGGRCRPTCPLSGHLLAPEAWAGRGSGTLVGFSAWAQEGKTEHRHTSVFCLPALSYGGERGIQQTRNFNWWRDGLTSLAALFVGSHRPHYLCSHSDLENTWSSENLETRSLSFLRINSWRDISKHLMWCNLNLFLSVFNSYYFSIFIQQK